MNDLPPVRRMARKDAYHMLMLKPIEDMTKSLNMGDGWDLVELEQFVRRCKALVDAYGRRMKMAKGETE